MKKLVTWIVILLVLGGAGVAVFLFVRARSKQPLRYETVKVERRRVVAKVTASGTLSALVTVQVGSQVSGRVAVINVDFNSPVKKGEVIAKIDPQSFDAAVEQARANYLAAQANLQKSRVQSQDADRQLARQNELAKDKLVAQADRDTAQANADAAKAQVAASAAALEQARASLHTAQINLDYTTITSPIDGVVISRNVDVGQTVAASLQAPTLFTIAEDPSKMQVDTSVAEADVGRLTSGMNATFTVDAYPSDRFVGKVRQIRNAPQTVQNVVTYDAVIDVANPDLKLKPGMTANVTFVWAERGDALTVPNAALRFRPPAEALGSAAVATGGRGPGAGATTSAGGPAVAVAGSGSEGGGAGGAGGDLTAGRRGRGRDGASGGGSAAEPMGPTGRPASAAGSEAGSGAASDGTTSGGAASGGVASGGAAASGGPASPPAAGATGGAGPGRRRSGRGDALGDGGPNSDRRTIWVLREPNQPSATPIRTGISDGTYTEILEGAKEGDLVVTDVSGGRSQGTGPTGAPPSGGRGFGRVL
jgi:HlyD family secretion protein